MLTVDRVAALHHVGLFSQTPGRVLVAVARSADEVDFGPDESIIEEGATEDTLYVILSGRVRVHRAAGSIGEMGPGSTVGELAVLQPDVRSASVTAVEATRTLRLTKRVVDDLLVDQPEFASSIIAALVSLIKERSDRFATPEST